MRQAGRIVAEVLEMMRERVAPGVTTMELNRLAEEVIRGHGAIPSFKGYPPGSAHPFPASICASVTSAGSSIMLAKMRASWNSVSHNAPANW